MICIAVVKHADPIVKCRTYRTKFAVDVGVESACETRDFANVVMGTPSNFAPTVAETLGNVNAVNLRRRRPWPQAILRLLECALSDAIRQFCHPAERVVPQTCRFARIRVRMAKM